MPNDAELQRATAFVESGASLPSNWLQTLAGYKTRVVAWLVTPGVLEHGHGAAVKRLCALGSRRRIWADPAFLRRRPRLWLLLLEMVAKHNAKWQFLPSDEAWAQAKANAIQRMRSAEVLALVGGNDDKREAIHVFDPAAFLAFIARSDGIGSLGLADM